MGSYLSIVNDTPDTWYCQVGDDTAAAGIFTAVGIALTAVAAIVATAGAAAPLLSFASVNGVAVILGINTATALAIATAAASVSGTVAGAVSAAGIVDIIVSQTVANIKGGGYQEILPNASHRYGKYTLSLWRQGHCRRLTKNYDSINLGWVEDEVYMRPIFTGATDNSNVDHSLTYWINKFGLENRQEFRIPPPDGRPSWGDTSKLDLSVETVAPTSSPVTAAPTTSQASAAPTSLQDSAAPTSSPETAAPMQFETAAPSSSPMNATVCNVCGDAFEVSVPTATVFIPGNGNFSCGFLDAAGKAGNITEESCPFLPQFMVPCGCPGPGPLPPDSAPWLPQNTSSLCVCPSFAPSVSPNIPSASPSVPPASPTMGNSGKGYDEDADGGQEGITGKSAKSSGKKGGLKGKGGKSGGEKGGLKGKGGKSSGKEKEV